MTHDVYDLPGLPAPPDLGCDARCPPGTYDGVVRLRDRRRHRSRQGHRTGVRAPRRVDRDRQPQARAPRGRHEAVAELGAPVTTVGCDIRDPEQIAAAFDAATEALRAARGADQQRGRELPRARRGHVAQRVAHGRRHHAQRHVLLRARVRPPAPASADAGLDRQRRRVVRMDRRPRLRALAPPPRPA